MATPSNSHPIEKDTKDLADKLGVVLDNTQLHIGGERAIMSPHKFVLTGTQKFDNKRVVLKCATDHIGVTEIKEEHTVQQALSGLTFTEQELIMPREIFYGCVNDFTVSLTTFIEQSKVFTDYTLTNQFFMVLHAFEAMETFHATTREHNNSVRSKLMYHSPQFYLDSYQSMQTKICSIDNTYEKVLQAGLTFLIEHTMLLKAYDHHLIHSDLVPHNFRIKDRQLHLLDFVSFRLGNKYEGWARLINFMEVHSKELVPLLLSFIQEDRGEEEYLDLRLMRVYKICFLLHYYAKTLTKTEGDLHTLTEERLIFWKHCLQAVLDDVPLQSKILERYHHQRDVLRTETEKARQRQFTWVH